MAKTEKPPAEDATNLEKTKWAAKQLGADKAKFAEIVALLKEAKVPHSEASISQSVAKAREELGFPPLRAKRKTGPQPQGDEPTVSDLKAVRKLAEELSMKPHELRELVGKLAAFGDLAKLAACLDALEELTSD